MSKANSNNQENPGESSGMIVIKVKRKSKQHEGGAITVQDQL